MIKTIKLQDAVSNDTSANTYLKDAKEYWNSHGFTGSSNCFIYKLTTNEGQAFAFVRDDKKTKNVHLSRFVSESKAKGIGSQMIKHLKDKYTSITAWSKGEVIPFYVKNNFEIQYDSKNEFGYFYCVWDKEKR